MSIANEIPRLDEVIQTVSDVSSQPLSESVEVLSEYTVFEPADANKSSDNTDDLVEVDIAETDIEHASALSQPSVLNLWYIIKKSAINLILPFINGMMLGFGEILAHEIGFRYNWAGARVQPPRRMLARPANSKFL